MSPFPPFQGMKYVQENTRITQQAGRRKMLHSVFYHLPSKFRSISPGSEAHVAGEPAVGAGLGVQFSLNLRSYVRPHPDDATSTPEFSFTQVFP